MNPYILLTVFFVSIVLGYKLFGGVSGLLHTPLLSGMNALSGVTVLGALVAAGAAVHTSSRVLAFAAVFLAMVNIAGGFVATHRMFCMFKHKEDVDDE